jgi:hypothetical protein
MIQLMAAAGEQGGREVPPRSPRWRGVIPTRPQKDQEALSRASKQWPFFQYMFSPQVPAALP